MKEFERMQEIYIPHGFKVTKKYELELEKDAIRWFQETKLGKWYYQGGCLIFEIKGLGSFSYRQVVKWAHLAYFKDPLFISGYKFQLKNKGGNYDSRIANNPYSKNDFYRNNAWDAGYMYSLYNHKFNF